MKIMTANDMYAYEQTIIEDIGVPTMVLMEAAAQAVVRQMVRRVTINDRILIIAGSGNNGGDAIAVGRILQLKNYQVTMLITSPTGHYSPENKAQQKIARGYACQLVDDYQAIDFTGFQIFVDGLFGIGLGRPITGAPLTIINTLNQLTAKRVYAIDIPSGISAASGEALGPCVLADETITFGFAKNGMDNPQLKKYFGAITVDDIGFFF